MNLKICQKENAYLQLIYHSGYCLTKAQQEMIEPLLPPPKLTGRPDLNPLVVFNAMKADTGFRSPVA